MIGQSNNAIDEIIARVAQYSIKILRIGSQTTNAIAKMSTINAQLDENIICFENIVFKLEKEFASSSTRSDFPSFVAKLGNFLAKSEKTNYDFKMANSLIKSFLDNSFQPRVKTLQKHSTLDQIQDVLRSLGIKIPIFPENPAENMFFYLFS